MFHSLDRPFMTLSTLPAEKRHGVPLIEAYDWMGPEPESVTTETRDEVSLQGRLSGDSR